MNKFIAIILIMTIFFSSLAFVGRPAKAVLSTMVFDAVMYIGTWISNNAAKAWEYVQNNYDKLLRDIIAKRIGDYIVQQTIVWIQGGGKPKFIGNWEGFVKDVGDIAFDSVARETGLARLCSPFGLQIRLGLLPVPDFTQRITCTLDKMVSNINNFYVDFSVGGWAGYNAMWEPQNNYYGTILSINDEMMERVAKKTEATKSEGIAGGGFMGDKICKAGSGQNNNVSAGSKTGPAIDSCDEAFDNCDELHDICLKKKDSCISSAMNEGAKDKGYQTDKDGNYCDSKDLVDATPGSMIGKAVGEGITSDIGWSQNIQSWVSALVNAVINRVIKEGLSKMQPSSPKKPDRYYPPEYQNQKIAAQDADKQVMIDQIQPLINEWQYLLNAKNNSLASASSTLAVVQQLDQIKANFVPIPATATTSAVLVLPAVCDLSQSFINASTTPATIFPVIASSTIQITIGTLTGETGVLQAKINEANNLINKIKVTDFGDIQMSFKQFIDKYNTPQQILKIQDGSDRNAADAEKQAKQIELADIQSRLNLCRVAVNLPPVP